MAIWHDVRDGFLVFWMAAFFIFLFPIWTVLTGFVKKGRWKYTLFSITLFVLLSNVVGMNVVICIVLFLIFFIPTSILAFFMFGIGHRPDYDKKRDDSDVDEVINQKA
jgi:hypothetical protein